MRGINFKLILVTLALGVAMCMPVYATTLDEIANQQAATQAQTQAATQAQTQASSYDDGGSIFSGESSLSETSQGFINDINNAAKISEHAGNVTKQTTAMTKLVSKFITLIAYAIVLGLSATTVLDLAYIVIPFLRPTLSGGRIGVAQQSGNQTMNSGSGFGGGFGGGSSWGGGSGWGGSSGMSRYESGQLASNQGNANRNNALSTKQWVSDEALTAVASAQSVDPASGKPMNPLKIYAKAMTVKLIVVPILIVLSITGVLSDLGFFFADKICTLIYNVMNGGI